MTLLIPPVPQLFAFLLVAGLLTITPGADMALVMRHALGSGTRQALFATLGIAVGCLIWGTMSALGVSAIFARSATAFAALKYLGGAYLIYLGGRAVLGAIHGPSTRPTINSRLPRRTQHTAWELGVGRWELSRSTAFAQGLLTNLLNPKVAVFYVTFLPQFIAPDRPVFPQSIFLAATHVAMGITWLTIYARFIDRMATLVLTDRVRRRIEAVTGAVLMALGVRLALARR